jgi:predicted PurR-regulated permease PerM
MTARISTALRERFGTSAELPPQLQQKLNELAVSAGTWIAGRVVNLGMAIPDLISRLFIFTGVLGTLLPNYDATVERIKQLSPLDDRIDAIFLRKIKLTIWAMFLAIFVIAVAQGLLLGLFIWLAGIPFTSLWTLIAVVAAMLPLGASLVALPLGGIQLLIGNYTAGLIVLAGYLLVVSNLDSFIRPRLVPKEANLNFVLVLVSALGGYQLFGFFGVVYGPVLMIMLLTALEVYQQEYAGTKPAAPAESSDLAVAEALPPVEPAPAAPIPGAAAATQIAPSELAPEPAPATSPGAAASEPAPGEAAPAAPASQAPAQPDDWLINALTHQPQAGALGESLPKPSPAPSD